MVSKFERSIYKTLLRKPMTASEVAKKLEISHKPALEVLMHLALTREDIHYKNAGRIHIFWRALE